MMGESRTEACQLRSCSAESLQDPRRFSTIPEAGGTVVHWWLLQEKSPMMGRLVIGVVISSVQQNNDTVDLVGGSQTFT